MKYLDTWTETVAPGIARRSSRRGRLKGLYAAPPDRMATAAGPRRTMRIQGIVFGWLLAFGLAQPSHAGEPANDERARIDYMLNCQGCHLPNGEGAGDVPRMNGFVGHFLKVPGGREFLVQVPGSANAPLDDGRLAELLNWMLDEISRDQLPDGFRPYTADEVGEYRAMPLRDALQTRVELLRKIALLAPPIHE